MKIAVIYNRDSKSVINLFGLPNLEKIGRKTILRIENSLKSAGHQVKSMEGDKDLIAKLEDFMPKVLKGERPGLAFNISYGIQGQARYTHVPSILEMTGIPYVGSSPLAHSLALDKVVAKMIFRQNGLSTPDFVVLKEPGFPEPDIQYPLIVKPKNEAMSMGLRVVGDIQELREAAQVIFDQFNQPVLAEQYIEGREINVGLLGNDPPEAMPPCEIVFGSEGPAIYTIEDKRGKSGRTIDWICPAPLDADLTLKAQELAKGAFAALGCYDMARVDMRLDAAGNLYILEINSLPSLGEHGSYTIAAEHVGLDYAGLVNRMVEVASARYFGTPHPPIIMAKEKDPAKLIFSFITSRRDLMEKSLQDWTAVSSRTSDPVGNRLAMEKWDAQLRYLHLAPVKDLTDGRSVWTWQSKAGLEKGTLVIGHMDIPLGSDVPRGAFRREPEWLYGEGIGLSRAPLVMLDYALRSLRSGRWLHRMPLGILYYTDEGRDCRYSADLIRKAAARAKQVLVLRPSGIQHQIFVQRRGQRKYYLTIEGEPRRLGQRTRRPEVLLWASQKLQDIVRVAKPKDRLAVSALEFKSDHYPMLVPHRVHMTLMLSYVDEKAAGKAEREIKTILKSDSRYDILFEAISDRPPLKQRSANVRLAQSLKMTAGEWDIPLKQDTSLWPSVGGLVPARIPVVCGLGPVAKYFYTPREAVSRTNLVQRTLLLAEFLAAQTKNRK